MDVLTIFVSLGEKVSDECWGLPYNTHCDIPVLYDALPVFEVLCKRVLSFLLTCINSDCNIVSFVSRYADLYGRMLSPLGRNALYCSLPTTNLGFQIGGNEIEIVDEWPHLRHKITNRCDGDADKKS